MATRGTSGGLRRFHPGTVLQVEFDAGVHVYARMASRRGFTAFYDAATSNATETGDLREIVRRPILFTLNIFPGAYTSGRWPRVGHVPLDEVPITIPDQFMQNPTRPYECKIFDGETGAMRSALPEECVGLDRVAVWSGMGVEDRLENHYAGLPDPYARGELPLLLPPFDPPYLPPY